LKKNSRFRTVIFGLIVACFSFLCKDCCSQDLVTHNEPSLLSLSGGAYSVIDAWATTGYFNVMFQPGVKLWVLRPQAGALVSFLGGYMIYAGLTYPAEPVRWLVIQTGAAAGYYHNGNGINLGMPFEFRLSVAVLYKFRNYLQLGIEASHISNANFSPKNPGSEAISVMIQIPLKKMKAY
jgi:lipid A 3-O-deacylase